MKALILVDIQNDFLPGGALAVPGGDEVVAVANRMMKGFSEVVATQDWHPAGHGSFAVNHAGAKVFEMGDLGGMPQMMWPAHCVQGTKGAEFAPGLDVARITKVIRKGEDVGIDSYSGFFDNGHTRATGLDAYLKSRGVTELVIVGLATDYCVKFTALDAVKLGYKVKVVLEGCRGITAEGVRKAMEELLGAGVEVERER